MRGERTGRLAIVLAAFLAVGMMTALILLLLQRRPLKQEPVVGTPSSAAEPSASTVDEYLARIRAGTMASRAQRYGEALQAFEAARALRPAESLPYRYLAELYWREGKREQAAQAVHSLAAVIADAYAVDEAGRVYEESGLRGLATYAFQEAIRLDPHFPGARYNLGRTYLDTGDLERGIAAMQETLRLHPDFPEAHQALGMAYTEQGRLDQAIMHLQRALALQPDLTVVHNLLGRLYLAQGRLDEAIHTFRALIDRAPEVAEARHNLAVAYARKGQQELAIDQFKAALHLRPDFHAARIDLTTLLLEMRRSQEAIDLLREALTVEALALGEHSQRDVSDLRYRLAIAYRLRGEVQEAIRELEVVLRAEPAHGGAHAYLGSLYYQTQQFGRAWRHARQAESLGVPVAELITALRRVSVEPP